MRNNGSRKPTAVSVLERNYRRVCGFHLMNGGQHIGNRNGVVVFNCNSYPSHEFMKYVIYRAGLMPDEIIPEERLAEILREAINVEAIRCKAVEEEAAAKAKAAAEEKAASEAKAVFRNVLNEISYIAKRSKLFR